MDKQTPLKEAENMSDNNEPQETEKEAKVPEISVTSDKENGFPTTEKSDPEKPGCGKLRLSFLKAFDPLYSQSPEASEDSHQALLKSQKIRQQLIIEDSDSDSQVSPLPHDVSDDDTPFVDATYYTRASDDDTQNGKENPKDKDQELEGSLIKLYTPQKFDTAPLKDNNIPKSTSQEADSKSVLSVNKETVSTSVGDQSSLEYLSPSDSNRSEDTVFSEKFDEQKTVECEIPELNNKDVDTVVSTVELSDVNVEVDSSNEVKTESIQKLEETSTEKELGSCIDGEKRSDSFQSEPGEFFKKLDEEELAESDKEAPKSLFTKTAVDSVEETLVDKTVEDSPEALKEVKIEDKVHENFEEISKTEEDSKKEDIEKVTIKSESFSDEFTKEQVDIKVVEELKSSEEATETWDQVATQNEIENITKSIEKLQLTDQEKFELESSEKTEVESSEILQESLKSSESESAEKTEVESSEILQESLKSSESESAEKTEAESSVILQESLKSSELESSEKTKAESSEILQESLKSSEEIEKVGSHTPSETDPQSLTEPFQSVEKEVSEEKSEKETAHPLEEELGSSEKEVPDEKSEVEVNKTFESTTSVEESPKSATEAENTVIHRDEEQHLDSGIESIEESYIKSSKSPVCDLNEQGDKDNSNKSKMADLSEKLSEQQQENSELKLQLNAIQQAKASLELEIRQKEEVIIKTQAEALKNEQVYKQEIKQLREKLKENSKLIEKDGSKELEEQLKEVKAREAQALAELNQKNKDDLNYQKIMEEYENTIATYFADYQKLKEDHETATRHLANIELAFSDVHQKYERTKAVLEGFKANEETLTLSLQASEKTCKQHEERYESLKAHAKAQIEKSNKEIIMLKDKYEIDINKHKAIIKRLEIKCSSLEVSLQQKTEECAALSALCDEVTGKKV